MARRVLSVCYEECLPPSTLEFLRQSGCEMTCTRELGVALQHFSEGNFQIILINQTVSSSQEHLFVKMVRQNSDVPIVFVSREVSAKPEGVTAWVKPPIEPKHLLQLICELVPEEEVTRPN